MDRADLHRLVNQLPKPILATAARILEALLDSGDPVRMAAEKAPAEKETISPGEEVAVEEARGDVERGDVLTDAEFWTAVEAPED